MSEDPKRGKTAGSRSPVALLVVDSHRVFADALAEQLCSEIEPRGVHVAYSVEEASAALATGDDEVVVIHEEPGAGDGLTMLRELAPRAVDAPVLVLSRSDDVETVIRALRAGARGWISKDMDLEGLLEAMAQVARGHVYLSPPVLSSVVQRLLSAPPEESGGNGFIDSLSQREMEILRCLVAGMSKREVAARLYVSIHTVRSHVQRMMQRAGQHSTMALVAMARSVGVPPMDQDHLDARRELTGTTPDRSDGGPP